MQDGEPLTPGELAERTGTRERYIREWPCQQAARIALPRAPASRETPAERLYPDGQQDQ
jgi:hypothetical protein